jgi:hypothetical protein
MKLLHQEPVTYRRATHPSFCQPNDFRTIVVE